ncbi:hypothetical protein WR25_07534 [Diploscapter pachys]|uniref:Nematode cuticle collagen N-terminal domain-containing protein n=1 Tax=Diploscapter pachys TaxID=2018661 RepID=A0A2A2JKF1_9BILA|nr:hypothetical protein WR25_07534 [Diploscapter pachys]
MFGKLFAIFAVVLAVFTTSSAAVPVVPAVAAYAYSPYYYYPWAYPTVAVWGSDKGDKAPPPPARGASLLNNMKNN